MGTGPRPAARVFAGGFVDLARGFGIGPGRWHHVAANLLSRPRNSVRQVRDARAADGRADARRVAVPTRLITRSAERPGYETGIHCFVGQPA
jgi:hypothetical protein